MITLDLSILNQKGTPMFYSDIFAARPTFGIAGRIFISTDTAAIYRDTGSAWDLISDATGTGTNIYNSDGTLTGNRDVSSGGYSLTFRPKTSFLTSLTAANNDSSLSIFGVDTLSYAAGFSSNNIGALYGAIAGFNLQTFAGSATFAQANIASGSASINSIDFSSAGSTITMTQAAGIRAMAGNIAQVQYQGTNSGTITHAAIQQNLGFYRPSSATGILTITNVYSYLINALDDYGAGFSFTNRWGIYQAGASDKNYFAANMLLGSTTDNGQKLQVTGTSRFSGQVNIFDTTQSTSSSTGCLVLDGGLGVAKNIFTNGNIITNSGNIAALNGGLIEVYNSGNSNFFDIKSTNGDFVLRTNVGSSAFNSLTVTNTGNTLIGTTTDNGLKLQVTGQSYFSSNLGIGVTPSNWGVTIRAIDISTGGAGIYGANSLAGFTANSFIDNTTGADTYKVSDLATKYLQISGTHRWYTGPSGIAGNTITFTQIMTLTDAGNLLINSTSDVGKKLYLNGSFRIDGQTAGTAGGSSGQHLIINCDGTTYKIALLNN